MNASFTSAIPDEAAADMEAVVAAVVGGKPLDPELVRRVRARSEQATKDTLATHGVQDIGVANHPRAPDTRLVINLRARFPFITDLSTVP